MKAVFTRANYDYGNLDDLPVPDYEPFGVKDMVDNYSMATRLLYRYSREQPRPFIISAARSCVFDCSFCQHRSGAKYRERSIENVMAEIKEMYEKYHFNVLIILDELFAVSKERLKKFCAGILRGRTDFGWDFDWMFQTHANAKLDKESLALAKNAGCFFFSYGIESLSPTVLKSMRKHLKPEQIEEAVKLAHEAKVGFGGNLIFGDPAETEATILESLDAYFKYCLDDMVFLSYLQPYPGSAIFDYCVEKGLIKDKVAFYENIGRATYNMTQIPTPLFKQWMDKIAKFEGAWDKTKRATEVKCEETTDKDALSSVYHSKIYRITARCPFCNEVVSYRQHFNEPRGHIGTGCTKCGRRIRIDLA